MTGDPVASEVAEAGEPNYPIASVDSALRLLLLFGQRQQLRIADASSELGVAPSTAHRLTKMLEYHGFVRQDPDSKAYLAGPMLVKVGLRVMRDLDIRAVARPLLEQLVAQVSETGNLAVLQGSEVLMLDSIETSRSLRVGARTGRVMPAHASASGRALLAEMPPERVRELYASARLPRTTRSPVTTRRRLEEELAATRERGYAVQRGEMEDDVAAVAAAVRDRPGAANFAVALAVPVFRLDDLRASELGRAVVETAESLSRALPW
jgi:IclR family acetate operon transcriptional repressor